MNHLTSLLSFLSVCHKDADIFPSLCRKSIDHDISVRMPETLYYVSHGHNPIYIYNSPEGFICTDSTERSVQNFFKGVEERFLSDQRKDLPKYIHISKGAKTKVYFDAKVAKKEFEECPYRHHLIQRYIRVRSNSAWKVSVDWQGGNTKYYTVTNNTPLASNAPSVHKQISPVLDVVHQANNERFLIKFSHLKSYHVVASLQPILQLKTIVTQLIPLIRGILFNNKQIREIVTEFIKESCDTWSFIGIKGYLLQGEKGMPRTHKKKSTPVDANLKMYPSISISQAKTPASSDEEKIPEARVQIENKKIRRITRKLSMNVNRFSTSIGPVAPVKVLSVKDQCAFYLTSKRADPCGRIPFNMIGVAPQNMGSHATSFIETRRLALSNTLSRNESVLGLLMINPVSVKSNQAYLVEISKKLDCKINESAEIRRRNQIVNKSRGIIEELDPDLERVLFKLIDVLKDKECFEDYFSKMPDYAIRATVGGFMQMLQGTLTNYQLKSLHEFIFLHDLRYNEFEKTLEAILKENQINDSLLILQRFQHHHFDLVCKNYHL